MSAIGSDAPEQMGRYEIVQRLSAGGMGEVFVARVAGPGGFIKPVALKRIHPHYASDESFINMLHDEANVTAAIKHPNVVQIVEVGEDNGNHFVVLDYVSGETLSKLRRELIKQKKSPMPLWLIAWIGAEIASALHAAHEARSLDGEPLEIIHRDVSLGNIMLGDDGRPMLFDFGVAKAKQRLTHTTAGELKGKVAYMAPEIFRGQAVNRSVDLYALGVVLYELSTHSSPYQRDSDLETIAAIQLGEVPPVSEKRPDVDWLFDAIVMKTMAHERDERYPTGAQLEQALREWARKNSQPHDASSAAKWLADNFADRTKERRALLSQVASKERRPINGPGSLNLTGTNPSISRSVNGRSDTGRVDMTPLSTSTAGFTPPPVAPSINPSSLAATTPGFNNPQQPSRAKWIAGGVGACMLTAVAVFTASRPSAPPVAAAGAQPSASAATTAAAPPSTQAPTAQATSAAPSASAAPAATMVADKKASPRANTGKGATTAGPTATATQPTKTPDPPSPATTGKKPGLHTLDP